MAFQQLLCPCALAFECGNLFFKRRHYGVAVFFIFDRRDAQQQVGDP